MRQEGEAALAKWTDHSCMLSKPTFFPVPGWLDALQPLLDAGASVAQTCEGSPPLNMAVCMGSHPKFERFALAASSTLLDAGAVPLERYDWLHCLWSDEIV